MRGEPTQKVSDLTEEGFKKLLERLDADEMQAAEKYEQLRLKLIKCFDWKGTINTPSDELADITLDRVARKLLGGEEIENIDAYACQVTRFVWLEQTRKNKENATDDSEMPEQIVEPEIPEDPDARLECLRKCLKEVANTDEERQMIIGYYDTEAGDKIKDVRKNLADKLGITMNYLKQKALRLRNKLEICINDCVREMAV